MRTYSDKNGSGLIGQARVMQSLRSLTAKIATTAVRAVLIYGETGTGKALIARELHQRSRRAQKPFIELSCAALNAELFEAELFGYERSAFSGALSRSSGLIESANGGTIFFDDVKELDLLAQSKLLGLLETQQYRRVGSTHFQPVDIRVICSTNQILFGHVREKKFRDDLYYRLQTVPINVPPLREREDDIFLLTEYFIEKFNRQYGRSIKGWEPQIAEIFRAYTWPGNVRELENLVERIFVVEQEDCLLTKHIPPRIMRVIERGEGGGEPLEVGLEDYHAATAGFQTHLVTKALKICGGNLGEAARFLGLSRHALRHQMQKLHIKN